MASQGTSAPALVARDAARTALKAIKKNPKLAAAYERICTWECGANKADLLARWHTGKEILAIQEDPVAYGHEQDATSVQLISNATGQKVQLYYEYRQLALTWETEAAVKKLSEERDEKNQCLSLHHVLVLAQLDEKQREKILARWRKEGWTVAQMRAAVQQMKGGPSGNNKHGRLGKVRSPSAGFSELTRVAYKVVETAERNSVAFSLLDDDLAHVAPGLLEVIDEAIEAASDAIEHETNIKRQLEEAKEKVTEELQRQEEEAQQKAATGEAKKTAKAVKAEKAAKPVKKALPVKAAAPSKKAEPAKKGEVKKLPVLKKAVPAKVTPAKKALPLPTGKKSSKSAALAATSDYDIE